MNPQFSINPLASARPGLIKTCFYMLLITTVPLLSGCSRTGLYSIIITNPGVQHERNDLIDLPEPYTKKDVIFPSSVRLMSDEARKKWLDTLSDLTVYEIDTSLRVDLLSFPASATINVPKCGNSGIAIVLHDDSQIVKQGKEITFKLRYVCMQDSPGMVWAATEFYKIEGMDDCPDGFHTLEFQFFMPRVLKKEKEPRLMRVMAVCADL